VNIDETHPLRATCGHCGGAQGRIRKKSDQNCVYCVGCDRWQYNAPKVETGEERRSLSRREAIKPKRWIQLLELHGHACFNCGARPPDVILHAAHLISRKDAEAHGFLDEVIDSDTNLVPMCETCNAGYGRSSVAVALMYRALVIKHRYGGTT